MKKALIRQSDGLVVNVIEWKLDTTWQPPDGHYIIDYGNCSPGDTWDGSQFIPKIVPDPEPHRSSHISELVAVTVGQAKPARVKRVWQGKDYYYDCYVSQTVRDEFVAGNIQVGDRVLVHFDDIGEQLVTAKVFKSW